MTVMVMVMVMDEMAVICDQVLANKRVWGLHLRFFACWQLTPSSGKTISGHSGGQPMGACRVTSSAFGRAAVWSVYLRDGVR